MELNKLAKEAYQCAVKRGKIKPWTDWEDHMKALSSEVTELTLSYSGSMEDIRAELADVMLVCMSTSVAYKIDLEKAIEDKMKYNEKRID